MSVDYGPQNVGAVSSYEWSLFQSGEWVTTSIPGLNSRANFASSTSPILVPMVEDETPQEVAKIARLQ